MTTKTATIPLSEMTRAEPMLHVEIGQYVAWNFSHKSGGVQRVVGLGATADEAFADGVRVQREAAVGEDIDSVQQIIADAE